MEYEVNKVMSIDSGYGSSNELYREMNGLESSIIRSGVPKLIEKLKAKGGDSEVISTLSQLLDYYPTYSESIFVRNGEGREDELDICIAIYSYGGELRFGADSNYVQNARSGDYYARGLVEDTIAEVLELFR